MEGVPGMSIRLVLLLCLVGSNLNAMALKTVDDCVAYAIRYSEKWRWAGSWKDPEFPELYRQLFPPFTIRLLQGIGLIALPWDQDAFWALLESEVGERGVKRTKHPVVSVFEVSAGDKLIIFGDLYGAFHSFTRDLQELLHQMKVIDNDFKIVDPRVQIIFLGNVVNLAPYSLELLFVVQRMRAKNPGRVYYLRGAQETDNFWEDFSLLRGQMRIFGESKKGLLNQYFAGLPDGLELRHRNKPAERAYLLGRMNDSLLPHSRQLQGVVTGTYFGKLLSDVSGLQMYGFVHGAPYWQVFSAPTALCQDAFGCYNDAFAVLEIGESLAATVLTLHHRDTRKMEGFSEILYDFSSGCILKDRQEIERVSKFDPIFIGANMAQTGAVANVGYNVRRGIEVVFEEVNKRCGIQGHCIRPVFMDDRYIARISKKNMEILRSDYGIDIVTMPGGTGGIATYFDQAERFDIAIFFMSSAVPQYRKPWMRGVLHLKADYPTESRALARYMKRDAGANSFALIFQNDAYGVSLYKAARQELEDLGVKSADIVGIPFLRQQTTFKKQVDLARMADVNAIGFFTASVSAIETMLDELGPEFLRDKKIFTTHYLDSETFTQFRDQRAIKAVFSYFVPDPRSSNLPIMIEYRTLMNKYGVEIGGNSFEGFLAAMLICDALEHIGEPFTKERLMSYFESLKEYNFKGLVFTFNPQDRTLNHKVWFKKD